MKSVAGILTVAVMLCFLFSGTSLADTQRDYRDQGVIISASPFWKPYSFLNDDGEPAGFFIDFWNKWSEKTGVKVTFKMVSWSETIDMVANGQVDMQSGLYFTEERDRIFDFSQPVFYSKAVLILKADVPCEANLTTLKWGGVKGTVEKDFAQELSTQDSIRSMENSEKLFAAVAKGDIQATVDDWSTFMLLGKELGLMDDIKICRTVYEKDLLSIVKKGRTDLLHVVNEGLSRITEDEKRFLVNKWFVGEEAPSSWWRIPFLMVVAVVIVSVGFLYHSGRRRHR